MTWLTETLFQPSAIQAVIIISLICAVGLAFGKIHIRGMSLGVTWVFFFGILAGALGLTTDAQMLSYAESFGLIIFVYALGLQVGPGFISSFRQGGAMLNFLAIAVVLIGTIIALIVGVTGLLPLQEMIGVLCGATTNTPALGAAQQTLKQLGQPVSTAALSCALTYPIGMIGVILALVLVKGWLCQHEKAKDTNNKNEPFIASFLVCNPAIFNRSLGEISKMEEGHFVVSRLWRNEKVILPNEQTKLQKGDRILVIMQKKQVEHLTFYFGQRDDTNWNRNDVDWNAIDNNLVSQRIVITRPEINGRHLGSLQLRNLYGVNVSRVKRAGILLVATPDLTLRLGDRVTVVGEEKGVKRVAEELGNVVKRLDEPNMVTIFLGIVLGLLLGSIPLFIPGLTYPVKLGLAGGSIIMGILIGAYGPRFHMITYTTTSANLMLRSLGLSMYLACLGFDAGKDFLSTVMQPAALLWIGISFLLTLLPVIIMSIVSVIGGKQSYATTAGMLCGAMANPIALNYVNENISGDKASIAYATVYPLCMFLRVIIAQLIVMLWI